MNCTGKAETVSLLPPMDAVSVESLDETKQITLRTGLASIWYLKVEYPLFWRSSKVWSTDIWHIHI